MSSSALQTSRWNGVPSGARRKIKHTAFTAKEIGHLARGLGREISTAAPLWINFVSMIAALKAEDADVVIGSDQ